MWGGMAEDHLKSKALWYNLENFEENGSVIFAKFLLLMLED